MARALLVLVTVATLGASAAPEPARAGGGNVAAGIVGGLAVGTLFGAAIAQPRPYYYAPAPVYVEEPPVYVAPAPVYRAPPPPRCYWTRGEPVWDGYAWRRPRMQVCD